MGIYPCYNKTIETRKTKRPTTEHRPEPERAKAKSAGSKAERMNVATNDSQPLKGRWCDALVDKDAELFK
jgi:hypothetical protein